MRPVLSRATRGALFGVGVALIVVASGCERTPPEASPPPATTSASKTPTETYEVRGEVVSLPDEGKPLSELRIRHEHIPEFINFAGENPVNAAGVRGMASMTMPFPVDPGVLPEGLAAGNKILFTLAVDRDSKSFWVSKIEKLPADTELDFGVKAP
ncbi:MAG: copper-binding protein [Phycisphaerales bacterium]